MTGTPAPHALTVLRYTETGDRDAHNNPVHEWVLDPNPVHVHYVAPGPADESLQPGSNPTEIALNVGAPPGVHVAARDRVVWQGEQYEVVGEPMDWTKGPWPNPAAGVVFELRRTEG